MKVVKIINSLGFGGIERVFEIVAKYHEGDKNDLVFISLGHGGAAEKYITALGYRVIVLQANTKIPNFSLVLTVYRLLKREKPTVVHTCGAEANFHGLLAAWLARVPVRIGEEIGLPSHSAVAKKIFTYVYKCSTAVIAVAHSVADYLRQNKEVSGDKLKVIYNPVDTGKFLQQRKSGVENFIILSVCRLHPIKNLKALIRVFARILLKYPTCRLWLVGDGGQRQELEDLARDTGAGSEIKFWGFHDNPSIFYAQANAFVLPSFSEGHPVSLVEAMVSGVPVIATKVGGAPEIITAGTNGLLIDPYDDDDIFSQIERLILLPLPERERMVAEAKQQALHAFSPEEYLRSLNSFYKTMVK